MSKPTAVQWLIKELKDLGYYTYNLEKLCEQAKQMEKEQIIDAFFEGAYGAYPGDNISCEQYYNETFGGKTD